MNLGSLFSGGGLGDFGFQAAGFNIRWQVEIDEYCQKILALRYPESEKFRDIKTLRGVDLEPVDIITGGFPCQPFSVAGKQKGKEDNRYLWPEMLRVIKECRPRWVVGENVPGIINLALDTYNPKPISFVPSPESVRWKYNRPDFVAFCFQI
jgi:DNA (cytosine-5)-methyltransferase 1